MHAYYMVNCNRNRSQITCCMESMQKNLLKLQRVQNNLTRITLMAPRRSSAEPLYRSLHWLPIMQRIHYKITMLTQRALTTSQPPYLLQVLQRRTVATCRPRLSFRIYTEDIPLCSTDRLEHTADRL